ncbi:hypothetical protein ACFVY9_09010 [Streptomyces sp. NPDC059544]|uniref:hypothetical protein n=1 Tax=Streptomyces sp. NPDC059544 TaxID=3346861 RepID=UPI00369C72CA
MRARTSRAFRLLAGLFAALALSLGGAGVANAASHSSGDCWDDGYRYDYCDDDYGYGGYGDYGWGGDHDNGRGGNDWGGDHDNGRGGNGGNGGNGDHGGDRGGGGGDRGGGGGGGGGRH